MRSGEGEETEGLEEPQAGDLLLNNNHQVVGIVQRALSGTFMSIWNLTK